MTDALIDFLFKLVVVGALTAWVLCVTFAAFMVALMLRGVS